MQTTGFLDRLFLTATAFGAGVALGLLLAPDAGPHTRARLADGAREAATAAGERSRELAAPVAERARETVSGLAERHLPLSDDFEIVDGDAVRAAVRESGL